jgi:hypothetical protein
VPDQQKIKTVDSSVRAGLTSAPSVAQHPAPVSNAESAEKRGHCGVQPTPETVLCLWSEGQGKAALESWYEDMSECRRKPVRSLVEELLPWRRGMDRGGCGVIELGPRLPSEQLGSFRDSDKRVQVTTNGERQEMTPRQGRYAALEHGAATVVKKGGGVDQMLCGPDIEEGCKINQWRPLPETALAVHRNNKECELETGLFSNHLPCAVVEAEINRARNKKIPRKMAETGRSAETIVDCESVARTADANALGAQAGDLIPIPGPGTGVAIVDAVWGVATGTKSLIDFFHNDQERLPGESVFEQCLRKTPR